MTLLPSWPGLSIQMAPIHLPGCHCGPGGALHWGLGPRAGTIGGTWLPPLSQQCPCCDGKTLMWGDDTATSISMALTPCMKPPERGKDQERWIQLDGTELSMCSIGYSVSKEAGVGESKDVGDKGVGLQSKQGRKMQKDYNKEGCGGQTQTHYSIRQREKLKQTETEWSQWRGRPDEHYWVRTALQGGSLGSSVPVCVFVCACTCVYLCVCACAARAC